jgi:hypothetical protein
MFKIFRLRSFLTRFFDPFVHRCQQLSTAFKSVQPSDLLAWLTTQTLAIGALATVLWLGLVGTYTPVAHAGDNLDARPYEAEAVRQSRSPASRENPTNGVDQLRGVTSKAPEDVANEALENVKDAIKDVLPGMSADDQGVGQNAYNPNTQHSATPKR